MRISDWSSDVCSSDLHRILAIPSVDSGRVEDVASRMILQDRPNKLSNTFLHIRQRIEQAGRGWSPCYPCGGPQFWGSIMMSKLQNARLGFLIAASSVLVIFPAVAHGKDTVVPDKVAVADTERDDQDGSIRTVPHRN